MHSKDDISLILQTIHVTVASPSTFRHLDNAVDQTGMLAIQTTMLLQATVVDEVM